MNSDVVSPDIWIYKWLYTQRKKGKHTLRFSYKIHLQYVLDFKLFLFPVFSLLISFFFFSFCMSFFPSVRLSVSHCVFFFSVTFTFTIFIKERKRLIYIFCIASVHWCLKMLSFCRLTTSKTCLTDLLLHVFVLNEMYYVLQTVQSKVICIKDLAKVS